MFDIKELEQRAEIIPSMGGMQIGPYLRGAARNAEPNTAIVEAGTWLGAGTAQLALGLRERVDNHGIQIYCFDAWEASQSEVEKAKKAGMNIKVGADTLPDVKSVLEPFNVPIQYVKGRIESAKWQGAPISVYVQDAGKGSKPFFGILKRFGPSFVPGVTTLFLMDYFHYRKSRNDDHKCQKEFIEGNQNCFSEPQHIFGSSVLVKYRAAFDFSSL